MKTICRPALLIIAATTVPQACALADQQLLTSSYVLGYTNQLSYLPGETVSFHLSTTATKLSIAVARAGQERVKVWEQADVVASAHPIPDRASSDGCQWPVGCALKIPDDWKSGYYVATVSAADNAATTSLFFVVRSAEPWEEHEYPAAVVDEHIQCLQRTGADTAFTRITTATDCRGTEYHSTDHYVLSSVTGKNRSSNGPKPSAMKSIMPSTVTLSFTLNCCSTTDWY